MAVNNYEFAKTLDQFYKEELCEYEKKVTEAFKIVSDINYKWADDKQKEVGEARFKFMQARLALLKKMDEQGKKLSHQHESLTDRLAKWYVMWYENISNDGRQDTEMMEMQADMLNQIFGEMYQELKGLAIESIKPPKALNMK